VTHSFGFVRLLAIGAISLTLVSCSRSPDRYVQSGNKFFDRGKYKEAAILYRNAIKADPKFGEGYFRLAVTELKMAHYQNAVGPLRRAIELLPKGSPDWLQANIEYAEILIGSAPAINPADQPAQVEEARSIRDMIVSKRPDAFEGQRLTAEIALTESLMLTQKGKLEEATQKLNEAVEFYRKTLAAKPGDTKIMMSLAKTLVMAGNTDEAKKIYLQVIDKDKSLLAPYDDLYRLYFNQRKYPEAEQILKSEIANHPKDPSLEYRLALFYVSTHNEDALKTVLAKLKARSKEDRETYMKLGDFYVQIGRPDDAIRTYQEGLAAATTNKLEYQKRIIAVLIGKGQTTEAYAKVEEVLKQDPKDMAAHTTKANFLLDKHNVDGAISEYQTVIHSMPNNYIAQAGLGRAFLAKNDLTQATHHFEASLALNPDYLPSRLALARIALQQGNWDRAMMLSETVLKTAPAEPNARLIEAVAYGRRGEYDKARNTLEALLKADPKQGDALAELALLDLMQKKYKEAEDLFQRAYDADPSNVRGLVGVAQVRMRQNNSAAAVQVIAEESKKYPDRADIRKELANVELQSGRFDQAIADYRAAVEKLTQKPLEQAEIYGRIAQCYEQKGDLGQAAESYRKARQLAPAVVFLARRLADVLDEAGKTDEALSAYRDAMRLDPNDPGLLNAMAWSMAKAGRNLDEALTLAQRARQQLSTFYDAADTIGFIYLKKGLADSAIEIFRDLNNKVQDNPTYHYHYGMALAQKGDRLNAMKEFNAALKNNPSRTEIAEIKDQLQKLS